MNIAPILLGVLLRFPGVSVESAFPSNASTSLEIVATVLINGVAGIRSGELFRVIRLANRYRETTPSPGVLNVGN
jgi:hypothetical protein